MDSRSLHETGVEMIRLVKATLYYYRKFSKATLQDDKISACGLQILTTLRYYPDKNTVSEISDSLNVSRGLVSREVEALRKAGYVETAVDATDRRVLHVNIVSEKAEGIVKKQKEKLLSFLFQMSEGLTDEELIEFRRLNSKVFANVDNLDLDKEYELDIDLDELI